MIADPLWSCIMLLCGPLRSFAVFSHTPEHTSKIIVMFYYYAAFNAPCVGHKDDKSQALSLIAISWSKV